MTAQLEIDLKNCYHYRLTSAESLSRQPDLNDTEIIHIRELIAQCELLSNIISKETGNYSIHYDFVVRSRTITERIA